MTNHASAAPPAATPQGAQARFDAVYISSGEICRRMNVSRATVLQARRRKLLPDPVAVDNANVYVWERAGLEPYLEAWALILGVRRANQQPPSSATAHA